MSQRRGGAKEVGGIQNEEMVPFSQSLDTPGVVGGMDRESSIETTSPVSTTSTAGNDTTATSVSLDARYHIESLDIQNKAWQESYFARGAVRSTWEAEYAELHENGWNGECSKMMDGNPKNSVPCGCCSAIVCTALGAGRVGNMAVLKQSNEWVTEEVPDEENGGTKTIRVTRPRLDFVVGPVSSHDLLAPNRQTRSMARNPHFSWLVFRWIYSFTQPHGFALAVLCFLLFSTGQCFV